MAQDGNPSRVCEEAATDELRRWIDDCRAALLAARQGAEEDGFRAFLDCRRARCRSASELLELIEVMVTTLREEIVEPSRPCDRSAGGGR
jgi:hypothetical protein